MLSTNPWIHDLICTCAYVFYTPTSHKLEIEFSRCSICCCKSLNIPTWSSFAQSQPVSSTDVPCQSWLWGTVPINHVNHLGLYISTPAESFSKKYDMTLPVYRCSIYLTVQSAFALLYLTFLCYHKMFA